jgi:D-methionine transport system ATP-binding protein
MLRLEQVNLYTRLKSQNQGNLPGYPILQDISLQISPGDRLTIVGASGAGKTSLLRLINRLTEPSSGKIYLDNQEYSCIPILELRQAVTMVMQEPKLLGMTVGEAFAYPLVLRGISKQIIQERVNYWREQLHIPEAWLNKTEVHLSSGERQLVAIARALVIQPQILLLDEPTSALDIGTAAHLIHILTQLPQTHSTTIVMVNHQLELAAEFSTRLLHLHQGQIFTNQPATEINWQQLKTHLSQVEAQATAEWI